MPTKKSPAQLDREIAAVLAGSSSTRGPSVVYLQTRDGANHELTGRRLAALRKQFASNQGGPALTNLVAAGYVGFVGADGELWDLEALPDYVLGR